MRTSPHANLARRRRLVRLLRLLLGLAAVLLAVPFVGSLSGGHSRLSTAPVRYDLSRLAAGQAVLLRWDGKPVWVLHRSPAQLAALSAAHRDATDMGGGQAARFRSVDPRYFVVLASPGYAGCMVQYEPDKPAAAPVPTWNGGFVEPCVGAWYDTDGRVFPGSTAQARDLAIPPYRFVSPTEIELGGGERASTLRPAR